MKLNKKIKKIIPEIIIIIIFCSMVNVLYVIAAPILTEVTPVPSPTNDNTPSYTFHTDTLGTVSVGGDCSIPGPIMAGPGNIPISFETLADETYSNCTVKVTDVSNSVSNPLNVNTFTVDTTPPELEESVPVTTPSEDATPSYVFYSTEAGVITYGGDCESTNISGLQYDNAITFMELPVGTYSNCTIRFTDDAGNMSSVLNVSPFTILEPVCDEDHYDLCTDYEECDGAGGFWCSSTCQESACDESGGDSGGSGSSENPGEDEGVFDKLGKIIFKQNKNKFDLSTKSNNYIKKNKLTFEGVEKGLAGGEVKLYVESSLEKTEDIESDGEWKVKHKTKKEEKEEYKLKFYNKDGEKVDSKSYSIYFDEEDPLIDIPDYLNKSRGGVLWWDNSDNHKIKKTYIWWDGSKYKYKFKEVKKGETRRQTFTIPANATRGRHDVKIKTYDKAGNKVIKYMTVNVY